MHNGSRRIGVRAFVALTAALAAVVVAAASLPAGAVTTSTTSTQLPIALDQWVPCANDGAGEGVRLGGVLHSLSHTTVGPDEQLTVVSWFNPQGVQGEGLTTGDLYQGTGSSGGVLSSHTTGTVVNQVNDFRLIGRANAPSLVVHVNVHLRLAEDGTVLSEVSNISVECR